MSVRTERFPAQGTRGDERRQRVTITASGRDIYTRLLALEQDDDSLTAGVSDPPALRALLIELIRARHEPAD